MFERVELAQPSHKAATTVAFVLNSSLVLLAVALPLFRTAQLPSMAPLIHLTPPHSAPPAEVQPSTPAHSAAPDAFAADSALHPPSHIPIRIDNTPDAPSGMELGSFIPGAPAATGPGVSNMPWLGGNNPPPIALPRAVPRPTIVNISHLDPGALVKYVQPIYPNIARLARVQGTVVLSATIDPSGRIVGLRAVRGPGPLVAAAMEAVEQWRYRPYILNGSPIAVQTEINVNFTLQ